MAALVIGVLKAIAAHALAQSLKPWLSAIHHVAMLRSARLSRSLGDASGLVSVLLAGACRKGHGNSKCYVITLVTHPRLASDKRGASDIKEWEISMEKKPGKSLQPAPLLRLID